MFRSIALLTSTLVFFAQCDHPISNGSLRGNHFHDEKKTVQEGHKIFSRLHREVDIRRHNKIGEPAKESSKSQFCNCNSSACVVDTQKLEHDLQNDLVLFLGSSIDLNAIEYFCRAARASVQMFETKADSFSYLAHCDVGKFTVAYAFHPGATSPYFSGYSGRKADEATTFEIVKKSAHDVQKEFKRSPAAIVVDSSLWDVSSWWEKNGKPKRPYPMPSADISKWCHQSLPNLLNLVASVYPTSAVVYRTPPTLSEDSGYGQDPAIIDTMVKCVEQQRDPLNRASLYGRFGLIDYHHFVDKTLEHVNETKDDPWYKDGLHPGSKLSIMYMDRVLIWVSELKKLR